MAAIGVEVTQRAPFHVTTVPRASMEIVGMGASEPLDRSRTLEARARNRRVELWKVAP